MELYNTTIDGKSPLFTYTPFRAAGVEGALGAWTLANPDLVRGTSYTTNHTGANVGLQWTGTSIWLYGSTRARSNYQIIRSWSDKVIYGNGTNGTDGVLFSESDLNYGSYTVALSVIEGSVTVSRATITVGMGVPGTALQSQNQSAAAGGGQVNPYFRTSANSSWAPFILEGSQSVLRTTGFGDRITFTVQSSVGFAIYGTTAFESGAYNISVVPPPDNLPSIVQYNASTAFEVLDALKFLATGLNETMDYTVTMTNTDRDKTCDIGQVVLHSAVQASSSPISASSTSVAEPSNTGSVNSGAATSGRRHLSPGDIAGIAIGCAACLFISWVIISFLRSHRPARSSDSGYASEKSFTSLYRRHRYQRGARGSPPPRVDLIEPEVVVIGGEREPMVPELAVTAYTKAYSDFVSQQVVRPSADAEGLVENALPSGPITENENASPSGPSTGNASSSEARADDPIPIPPIPAEDAGPQTSGARPPSYKSEWRVPIKHAARKSKQKVPSSFRMRVEGGPVPP